ncbi:MAG: polyprenyl synthetase family protein [Candidatus Omnitrophica bacterium]|nr:polyprenyl synthetase family protein [Candidatus Omnitrophota bacterium]
MQADLEAVAERMLSQVADPVVRKVVYLIIAGGKRLRPALVLLAGASGPSARRDALLDAATAVELIHTATLIHDDIIDQSPLRRSQPAFHHRWGTERAVLMGDYLYATAFTLLARLDEPEAIRIMADVCRQLCRGELREVEARYRLDLTEEEYFGIIEDKTASLIGGCCRSGAILGGCPPEAIDRLAAFGVSFGLAFQIIDDCLDLTGDPRELGKSIHADLDKGALSLPIIYLTQMMPERARRRLFAPLRTRASDPAFLARVAKEAIASGAVAKAQARAHTVIQPALEALAGVPMNGLMRAYQRLAAYVTSRRA